MNKKFTKKKVSRMGLLAVSVTMAATLSFGVASPAFAAIQIGLGENGKATYTTDYKSPEATREAARKLNVEAAASGMILLKNKEISEGKNSLPLAKASKVSVFGAYSNNLYLGGGGSGAGSMYNQEIYGSPVNSMNDVLEESGFEINPTVSALYPTTNAGVAVTADDVWPNRTATETLPGRIVDAGEVTRGSGWANIEYGLDHLTAEARASYANYNDAAVVVIGRNGSEGLDYALYNVPGHSNPLDHYYMLDDNEHALIKHVEENFDNVIVILNTGNAMQVPELESDDKVSSVIWMGYPGENGALAVGEILNGNVNPSGKTADAWAANVSSEPVWQNLGGGIQNHLTVKEYTIDGKTYTVATAIGDDGEEVVPIMRTTGAGNYYGNPAIQKYFRVTDKNGDPVVYDYPGVNTNLNYLATLEYEEGIYVGYKWYETAWAEGYLGENYNNSENGVVYPFGYGLSYTTFTQEIINKDILAGELDTSYGAEMTLKVKVTNTGKVAGRDVVQVYYNPEYIEGGIEKAEVNLIAFEKTELLQPGKSEIVEVTFKVQDMAAFDYNDANESGHAGYELDPGTYSIGVYKNSHEVIDEFDATVSGGVANFDKDTATGNEITTLFSGDGTWDGTRDDNEYYTSVRDGFVSATDSVMTNLSRADIENTFPAAPTADDLKWSDEAIQIALSIGIQTSFNDLTSDPWYVDESDFSAGGKYYGWTQASDEDVAARVDGKTPIQLWEMSGVDFDDDKWVEFMNQLSWTEMLNLATSNGSRANLAIGRPGYSLADGPAQLKKGGSQAMWWCSGSLLGTTWDQELVEKIGNVIGNESLWGGSVTWYGPALNFHRSITGGRNFEFFSQDGVHGELMAAAEVRGYVAKGGISWMKHLAMNDAETYRMGISTWASEQAMRELYYRQFEIVIKEGNANATMSSYAKIGMQSSTNDHIYKMVRDQWGFDGMTITDAYFTIHQPAYIGMRTQIVPLGSWASTFGRGIDGVWDDEANCVVSTFEEIVSRDLSANINEVDKGASIAYKNNYTGKMYPTNAENINPVRESRKTFKFTLWATQSKHIRSG